MQIAHIDLTLIRDAFQFRLFMEKEAVALFTVTASDDTLRELRRSHEDIIARARQAITPGLVAEAQAIDWGLHDTIIDALGNEIISNAYRVNSIKIRLIREERIRILDNLLVSVMEEHLVILTPSRRATPLRPSRRWSITSAAPGRGPSGSRLPLRRAAADAVTRPGSPLPPR